MREDAIRGVKWSALQNWGGALTTTALFIFLARLLDPADFGLVALATVFIAFFTIFQEQGLGKTIVQRKDLEPEDLDTAFWFGLGAGLLLMGLLMAAAPLAAAAFHEPRLTPVLRWLSLNFLLGGLNGTPTAVLQRQLQFDALAMRTLTATLLAGIFGVLLAINGAGVWALVAQNVAKPAVSSLVIWAVCPWRPKFRFSPTRLKSLSSFGVNILAMDLLAFVNRRSDDLLIGAVLGPVALGYYTVAYRLLRIMTEVFTQTVSVVALPVFSRLQDDWPRMQQAFYAATRLTSALAFPAFIGVAAVAPSLVRVVFGAQWEPSIPVMQVLTLIGILQSVSYFNRTVMVAAGRPGYALIIAAANAFLNVVFFAFVVRWGILAVALAFTARGWIMAPVPLIIIRKLFGLEYGRYFRQLLPPIAASILMFASIDAGNRLWLSEAADWTRLAISIPLGAFIYILTLTVIAPALVSELRNVAQGTKRGVQSKPPTRLPPTLPDP